MKKGKISLTGGRCSKCGQESLIHKVGMKHRKCKAKGRWQPRE